MNSLRLGSDFNLWLDLTIFCVIVIPLMGIVYLVWDAMRIDDE